MKLPILLFTFALLSFGAVVHAQTKKVVLVVFENTTYGEALAQPFFAKFAAQGALLTNFHAIGHPSQPNYIALLAGSPLGVTNDKVADLNGVHFGDLLEAHGKTWRVYAEQFPGSCFLGIKSGGYARKHNPMISFTNVQNNPARCAKISDATAFSGDFKSRQLADFTMYIPDIKNDGHDTGAAFADLWFEKTFGGLITDTAAMQDVTIMAIFDEDDGKGRDNQVYAAFNGPDVLPGSKISTRYDHLSLLRTLEDLYQVGTLGRSDTSASAISGYLK